MENSTFFTAWFLTLLACIAITILLIYLIRKGLREFFENLSNDSQITSFFIRITNTVILLAGISAALTNVYDTGEKADWLTLTWNIADQVKETLGNLFVTLIILTVIFMVLHLISKRLNK